MDMRVGPEGRLSTKELMFSNYGAGEDSWVFSRVSKDSKDIKLVNPKGNQSWIFIGRTDAKAEAPTIWPPDVKSQPIRKDLLLGMIEGRMKWGQQSLDRIIDSMDMSLRKLWEMVKDKEDWLAAVHEVAKSLTWLSNWTTTAKDRGYPGEFWRRKIRRKLT